MYSASYATVTLFQCKTLPVMPVSVLHTLSYSSCCLTLSGQPTKVLFLLLLLTVVRSLCYTIYPQPYITSQRKKKNPLYTFFSLLPTFAESFLARSGSESKNETVRPSSIRPSGVPSSSPLFLHPFPPCSLSVCPFLSVLSVSFSSDASPSSKETLSEKRRKGRRFFFYLTSPSPSPSQPT